MKNIFILFLVTLAARSDLSGQYYTNQNKVWTFGQNAGIDFTSGSPVSISTSINTPEGCASVSNSAGSLLFYTDGLTVYNRTGGVMPAASSISPFSISTNTTTQGAVISPVIGNANQFFVFSLSPFDPFGVSTSYLAYSIVDMSLDGGMGNVVTSSKAIVFDSLLTEKMIAVKGSSNNIWLIAHKIDTALFVAYEITGAGVNIVPVVSAVGTFSGNNCYAIGVIKASPNGRKIVSQSSDNGPVGTSAFFGTELFDFDPGTGVVSHCVVLDSSNKQYGAEFSPDNSKLYAAYQFGVDSSKICQYDLSTTDADLIRGSKTDIIFSSVIETDIKLGPDNKLYFKGADEPLKYVDGTSRYLDCISSPNLAGSLCGYVPHAVTLASGTRILLGLPNTFVMTDAMSANVDIAPYISCHFYPNPASTNLSITGVTELTAYSIVTATGVTIQQGILQQGSNVISIQQIPSGMHLLEMHGADGVKNVVSILKQ